MSERKEFKQDVKTEYIKGNQSTNPFMYELNNSIDKQVIVCDENNVEHSGKLLGFSHPHLNVVIKSSLSKRTRFIRNIRWFEIIQ